jgi:high-affinity iron transporter
VFASLLVTLREGFEAALIVAIVLAYLREVGALRRARSVWAGVVSAAAVSAVAGAALFLTGAELEGSAEALFEGVVMLAAVAVLTWMIVWMQREARSQGARLRGKVDEALHLGGAALFGVAFLAVVREGLETALFLFAAADTARPLQTLVGGLAGLGVAAVLGWLVYRGSSRLPLRTFFTATNLVLIGFGTYLVWAGVGEIGEVVGGEAFEILGAVAAAVYAALALLALRRATRTNAEPAQSAPHRRAA